MMTANKFHSLSAAKVRVHHASKFSPTIDQG